MTFRTTDIYLAAYLQARGFPLRAVRGRKPRSVFLFEDHPAVRRDVEAFLANEATVSAFDYALALRSIKGLIHTVP